MTQKMPGDQSAAFLGDQSAAFPGDQSVVFPLQKTILPLSRYQSLCSSSACVSSRHTSLLCMNASLRRSLDPTG